MAKARYRDSTKRASRTHESQRRTDSHKMAPQDVYTSGVQRTRHRKPRPSTDLEPTIYYVCHLFVVVVVVVAGCY